MPNLKLSHPVAKLHLLSASSARALRRLGIETVGDLLAHFPRDWQDLSEIKKIKDLKPGEKVSTAAQVKKVSSKRSRWKRRFLTEALLTDGTAEITAVWFNQPYIAKQLVKNKKYYFYGKTQIYEDTLQLTHPLFEAAKKETIHTAGIVPKYDLTEGVTQKQMRYWLKQAMEAVSELEDKLPDELLEKYNYPDIQQAVKQIHFPDTEKQAQAAQKRLAFEELFIFQLAFASYKQKLKQLPAPQISFNQKLIKDFVKSLPFKLTDSQRLAVWEILQDLTHPHPMNRLLEGDVGSGKTVVAGIAALQVADAGFQSVILAPTEILALQHYKTLDELFKNHSVGLLTRNHKTVSKRDISSGKIKIVVGTHALLQDAVAFDGIGLLVVDEQHRFGVNQRAHLQKQNKQKMPHLLSMTATPIPRSLALALYGDLDISQLRQLPSGRKKIITKLVDPDNRSKAYKFIKKEIERGRQAYLVTPLIDESDKLGVKSATQEAEKLQQQIFPELNIGLLHGRMKGEDKKQVMEDFKAGQLHILVSTTVIEVGVDVPNATIMMIENAERFGLATLHQLRGRVGRSDKQSYCFLFAEVMSETTENRLQAVVNSTDGFALAEKDLTLRGPGELLGSKQAGFIPFKVARLTDTALIKGAQKEAQKLLAADPKLDTYPVLKKQVSQITKNIHLE